MTKNKIIAANWKMNCSYEKAVALLSQYNTLDSLNNIEVIVFPPSIYLETAAKTLTSEKIKLGIQNVSEYDLGAYTGEISAKMLSRFKCEYVILGHSERRALFDESNEIIAAKFLNAIDSNITPILCVGENQEERLMGRTNAVLGKQLADIINSVGTDKFKHSIIAYEPIWAIGTGKTATAAMVSETNTFIHQFLSEHCPQEIDSISLLYGGSLNDKNAADLLNADYVDGGLIGSASLNFDQFFAICQSA